MGLRLREVQTKFDVRLESTRGLAALIVAGSHGMCVFAASSTDPLTGVFFRYTNPAAAVFYFFVLSGYVLGRSFERSPSYVPFIVRRVFRILPLFIFSVLVAFAVKQVWRPDFAALGASSGFIQLNPELELRDIWDNLLFRNSKVNGPSWSIYPELLGSLLLPPLIYLHAKIPSRFEWLLFVVAIPLLALSPAKIAIWFYVGYWLPPRIAPLLRNSAWLRLGAFVIGYALVLALAPNSDHTSPRTSIPASLACAMIIASIVATETSATWLAARPLRFIGRVSYSFYLLHWPILYVVAIAALMLGFPHGHVGNLMVCFLSIAACLLVSALSYEYMERPFMRLGSSLTGRADAAAGTSIDRKSSSDARPALQGAPLDANR